MIMDEISGKGAANKLPVTKRSGLLMRETSSFPGQSLQPCNRLSCSSRLNMTKNSQGIGAGCTQKAKSVSSSTYHSSSKDMTGSSSKNGSSVSAIKNPKKEARKQIALQLDTDSSESSRTSKEFEVPEVTAPPGKIQKGFEESPQKGVTMMEVGCSSSGSMSISGSRNSSNIKNSPLPKTKGVRHSMNPNIRQCGLKNLRCNSTVDMVQSSRSSPENPSLSKRKDYSKGRISGETSTSRGKKTDETLPTSRNGVLISESRRTRSGGLPEVQRSAASVRVRRSSGSPSERNTSAFSNESQFTFSRLTRRDLPLDGNASSSSSSFDLSNESVFGHIAIRNQQQSSDRLSSGSGSSSPNSLGFTSGSLINWESFQHYTMEGVAEVLSALERIEQDDLTYEQLVSLETNLFLNSLNVYDQHQDMRMDIDNMSYEELLALEERMGTVSTALTEESLSKCLKRESYQKINCINEVAALKDDVKCSICQEEYVDDDEVGRLLCEHKYHVDCISQWLRLKNWCPICKSSAEPSPSSPRP